MQFDDILKKYRDNAYSKSDLGTKFEELMLRYFMTDPVYASELEKIMLWKDFFAKDQFGKHDVGIDLVAKTKIGEYWSIQCKCYGDGHRVTKENMDTFIATSNRTFTGENGTETSFSFMFIVASTDDWSENASDVMHNQNIQVQRITLSKLREARVDWGAIEEGAHGQTARKEKYKLREHQQTALDKALTHFEKNDRGTMIMACGTGKTFTSLRIAEGLSRERERERERENGRAERNTVPCAVHCSGRPDTA